MDTSKILVARQDGQAFIQIVGRGSFHNAHLVKSFYTELLKEKVLHFHVDLKECSYLDSTFLGTLTGLALKLKENSQGKLKIINVSSRNQELLQNLGLDRLFSLETEGTSVIPIPLEEAAAVPLSKTESGQNMLEAHENLMKIDARNVPKFKDVVAYLKEDLGQINPE